MKSFWEKKIKKNAKTTTWISLIIKIASNFILLPLISINYGSPEVVLWLLFLTIASIINMIDFGFSVTIIRKISQLSTENANRSKDKVWKNENKLKLWMVIESAKKIYMQMAGLAIILSTVLGTFFVIDPIKQTANPIEGWLSWLMMVMGSSIFVYGGQYTAYLQAINKIHDYRRNEIKVVVMSLIMTLMAIYFNASIIYLIVISQMSNLIIVILNRSMSNKNGYKIEKRNEESKLINTKKEIWNDSWRAGAGMLFSQIFLQGACIIYANLGDVADVESFLISQKIIQGLVLFSSVPFYTSLPKVNNLYYNQNKKNAIELAKTNMIISNFIFAIPSIFMIKILYVTSELFDKKIEFLDHYEWFLLILAILVERIAAMHLQLFTISNKVIWHKVNGLVLFVSTISSTILYLYNFELIKCILFGLLTGNICIFLPITLKLSHKFNSSDFYNKIIVSDIVPIAIILLYGFWIVQS